MVRREDGFFHTDVKKVKAWYPQKGHVVMIFFENSQIDKDFEENVWVPKADELRRIADLMDESDRRTFKLLGHGWEGSRPFHMLEEFI